MTVVVAFYCSDGVVLAADSMLTPTIGGMSVGHHHGKKVEVLPGPQLFAFAGDQGQGARFKIMASFAHGAISGTQTPIDYPLLLTQNIVNQFNSTGIANNAIGANTILAFEWQGTHQCCAFEGALQPRLLDEHHYYAALGSGKLSADPFLRFLVDIFSPNGPPSVREALFLVTWTIQHVINTNPGGVAGPIRIVAFERQANGPLLAREVAEAEIEEHIQATESAAGALRTWRDNMQSGEAAEEAPQQPEAPPQP
jgi:hypothetical protein